MSSSIVSQCSPKCPISTASRCRGVALSRRGNQAHGMPMVRPSDQSTHIELSSNLTAVAKTCIGVPQALDPPRVDRDGGGKARTPSWTPILTIPSATRRTTPAAAAAAKGARRGRTPCRTRGVMPDSFLLIALTIRKTPIIFGFSWGVPIWLRTPRFWGLEKLGFPWISLVRNETYQWVARDFPAKNFSQAPGSPEKPKRALKVEAIRKGGIVHGASLTRFLIVRNHLSPAPVERAKLASHPPNPLACR